MSNAKVLEEVENISSDIQGQISITVTSTHFAIDVIENPPADGISSETVALKELLDSILIALHSASKNCNEIVKLTKQS